MSLVTRLRRCVFIVLAGLWGWGVLGAQSPTPDAEAAFQMGEQSLAAKREDQALAAFRRAAELGHPQAMFRYAYVLSHPLGTNVPNWVEVVGWYERAASNRVVEAAFNRALLCLQPPRGLKEDPESAVSWLNLAATNGFAPAQRLLGKLYSVGQGVDRSDPLAAYWLRSAARQQNPEAIFLLSRLIATGRIQALPGEDSAQMLQSAAQNGAAEAQEWLARSLEGNLDPDSARQATRWYRAAAEQGSVLAQWELGRRLRQGLGGDTNVVEGAAWMLLATDDLNPDARQELRDLEEKTSATVWEQVRQRSEALRRDVAERQSRSRENSTPVAPGASPGSPVPQPTAKTRAKPKLLTDVQTAPKDGDRPGLPPQVYLKSLTDAVIQQFRILWREEAKKHSTEPGFGRGKATVTYRLHADGRLTDVRFEPGSSEGDFRDLLSEALAKTSPFTPWNDAVRRQVGSDHVDLVFTYAQGEDSP